jgi:predicted DsbA family dithiol-disulfide isomerase
LSTGKQIAIEYFSDVLCVWAYGAQIRLDQLKQDFGDQVQIAHRFLPLFAATAERIQREWGARGGYAGYNEHVRQIVSTWPHVEVHPQIWLENVPASSMPAHLFLKAVQLLEQRGQLGKTPPTGKEATGALEVAAWRVRLAFFKEARDVAQQVVLERIAQSLELPARQVWELIDSGEAHAALHLDFDAQVRYHIPGSPTLVLNEGRQRLYGNVGYRVIEANVSELLRDPRSGEATWC